MMSYIEKLFKNRRLSLERYNAVIGAVLIEGLLLSALLAKLFGGLLALMSPLALVISYLIVCTIGVVVTRKSDRPLMSFIGYNLVIVPTCILLSVLLKSVKADMIIHALYITAGAVLIMGLVSQLKIRIFVKTSNAIALSLVSVVIVGLIAYFSGWFKNNWWDAVAVIFTLYIGYTWSKAQRYELTLDGAIDGCIGLYTDIAEFICKYTGKLSKALKNFKTKLNED